jgi:aryl-alcohol dehydrogenase-like predicted oxidoreductase
MSDLAVAWVLHQPGVTGVLTGIRRPEQAGANARAADLSLDAATLVELATITEPVRRALGKNPDLWQGASNTRYR